MGLHGMNIVGKKNANPWKRFENVVTKKVALQKTLVSTTLLTSAVTLGWSRPWRKGRVGPTSKNWTLCVSFLTHRESSI